MIDHETRARQIVDDFKMATKDSVYTVIEGDDADQLTIDIAAYGRAVERETMEQCAMLAGSHKCGDKDDIICQHQNCALIIEGSIRREQGA